MLGVAGSTAVRDGRGVTLLALVTALMVGTVMALRAGDSIRTAEAAYLRSDRALAESERARDALALANEELAAANVQLRMTQLGVAAFLNLVDERTDGRLRALLEQTGDDLVEILDQQLEAL